MYKLLLLSFVSLLFTINLFTQESPPCWPDCPESAWTKAYLQFRMWEFGCNEPPDCVLPYVEIEYWHRYAECPSTFPPGSTIKEFDCQITKVTFTPSQCWEDCLDRYSIFDLYQLAVKKVLLKMKELYPENDQNEIWRVSNVPCWGRLTVYGADVLEYCDIEDPVCCWKKYRDNNDGTFTLVDSYVSEGPPPTCYLWTHPCYYICGGDSLEEPPPPPMPSSVNEYENENSFQSYNYNDLSVILNNNMNNNIKIYNLRGDLLKSDIITKENYNSLLDNIEKHKILFFQIFNDKGLIVKKGKIIF